MSLDLDEIEKEFATAVRKHAPFANWRKKGKRIFWSQLGDMQLGVELIRFKASFEKNQLIGVCAFVSFPSPEKPPVYVSTDTWRDGRTYVRAYVVPGLKMVDEPTFISGAVISLRKPEDLYTLASNLSIDFDVHLFPWLTQRETLDAAVSCFLHEVSIPRSLHVAMSYRGKDFARNELLTFLRGCPEVRPDRQLFDWSVEYGLLEREQAEKLSLASIQIVDLYHEHTRNLVDEIRKNLK